VEIDPMRPSATTVAIANNTAFQVIGKVVSMSVTILATIIITRIYGREGYGAFSLMQTFPALFFIIVDFGFNAIAARDLSADWAKAEKYLGNILVVRLLLSLTVMIVSALGLLFFPYSEALRLGIYLGLFLILTQALFATTNIIFQVKLRYDLSTIGYIAGSILVLLLVLLLSYLRVGIMWVNFSYVVGGLLTFGLNLHFINRLGVKIRPQLDKTLIKYLFLQSLPLGMMFIFSQVNFKADTILLSVMNLPAGLGFNNTETVAIYGLPFKIFEVSLVIPTFFMNAVYPVMVRHMLESKERLQQTFTKALGFLAIGGLVFGIIGIVLAPLAVQIIGGQEFSQSIIVLRILIGGLILFYLSQPLAWLLVTLGRQSYLPLIYLVSAVFNFSMNIIFIPRFSFYAASVITILSELIILVLLLAAVKKAWDLKYKYA
jgi:O-antigen/teichoic acid export membrane protein